MPAYIAILRGINVGGRNKIRMADLAELFTRLRFRDTTTYIQSGNIVFRAGSGSDTAIAGKIEKAIAERFGFEVPVIVRSAGEMRATVAANPFLKERGIDRSKLHLTFLDTDPDPALATKLAEIDYPPDRFVLIGRDIFLHCPATYGGTKLSNTFFERKLKVRATTRNWKTVTTLLKMAG